jgi:Domain of unknown function (DUF4395)
VARQMDIREHRFGSTLSAVLLVLGFVANVALIVPAVGLLLGAGGFYGTRWSMLGWPWPAVRRLLRRAPPRELESELPARFAQVLAAMVLGIATILFVVGLPLVGWLVAGALAALQVWLAVTGFCIGCRLYFLRWHAPALFNWLLAPRSSDPVDGSPASA